MIRALRGHKRWCNGKKEGLTLDPTEDPMAVPIVDPTEGAKADDVERLTTGNRAEPDITPLPYGDIDSFECRYLKEQLKMISRSSPLNIKPRPVKMFGINKFGIPQELHMILITSFMEKHQLGNEIGDDLLLLIRQLTSSFDGKGEIPLCKEYRKMRDHIVQRNADRLRTPRPISVDLPTEIFGDISSIPVKDRSCSGPGLNIVTALGECLYLTLI